MVSDEKKIKFWTKFTWTTLRYDSAAVRQILEDEIQSSSTKPFPAKSTESNVPIFSTIETCDVFQLAI